MTKIVMCHKLNYSFRFTVLIDGRARSSSAWSSRIRNSIQATKRNPTINNSKISVVDSDNLGATVVMMTTPG